jgi:hypothetical protein
MTPSARSLQLLRREGYLAGVVERWLPYVQRRADLFGFADLLAFHVRDQTFLLVQTTTLTNVAARLTKARARPELAAWLQAGGRFEVHGWHKRGGKWAAKRIAVNAEDLEPVVMSPVPGRQRRGP